ncbi:MAG: hypothetical protein Q4E75_00065 [bacterium]|nr:hypothetical protein [bacterium]
MQFLFDVLTDPYGLVKIIDMFTIEIRIKMNEIKEYTEKIFENIKHIDENGNDYWLARELMPLLEHSKWERFSNAINNAKVACEKSGYNVEDHFPEVGKLIKHGKGGIRKIKDYKLSRYACYLIVQNGDYRIFSLENILIIRFNDKYFKKISILMY